jgi:hypothetical protein
MIRHSSPPSSRRKDRITVDIPVVVTTVLDSFDASILDLTEYGALIAGPAPRKGTQFQIDYEGQTVFGFVIWAEVDRFGARFPFVLHDGPLHRRLEQARMQTQISGEHLNGDLFALSSRRAMSSFGRRAN